MWLRVSKQAGSAGLCCQQGGYPRGLHDCGAEPLEAGCVFRRGSQSGANGLILLRCPHFAALEQIDAVPDLQTGLLLWSNRLLDFMCAQRRIGDDRSLDQRGAIPPPMDDVGSKREGELARRRLNNDQQTIQNSTKG